MIPLGVLGASRRNSAVPPVEEAVVLGIRRPALGSLPSEWVCLDENGDPVTSGWQDMIDNHPTYAGVEPVVIDGQHMVRVPKFWIKTVDLAGDGVEYYIASAAVPGFQVHPAFYQAGDEIDQFWIGAYQASEVSSVFESKPGVLPRVNLSGVTAISRMEARNTGGQTGWGSVTWHQMCAVKLLILVELGTPDVKSVLGPGWNSTTSNTGSGPALQPTGTGTSNWRGIYDVWDNIRVLTTGIEIRDRRAWLADNTGTLVDTGHDLPSSSNYLGACATGDLAWAFLPKTVGSAYSASGFTSYIEIWPFGTLAMRHGSSFELSAAQQGLWSSRASNTITDTAAFWGFRLAKV